MKKKMLLASSVVLTLLWVGIRFTQQQADSVQEPVVENAHASLHQAGPVSTGKRPADAVNRDSKPTQAQLKERYDNFMAHRPLYLADVDLPGRYNVDENGNIVLDQDFKDMLDFFLEAIGDLSFDEIYDLLAGSMVAALEEPARSQALAFLDRYFEYIDAYDRWENSFDKDTAMAADPVSLRDHLNDLKNLRRDYLGEEAAQAFFGELDQTNDAYLEAKIALQQPNLSEQEKAAIRQHLEESLPADVREAQAAAMVQVNVAEKSRALQASGASDSEIFQARAAMVGEEAAQRLAVVDEENRQWDQKRSQYKALVSGTPGLDGMTERERQTYVADVAQRELGLSANEIRRMQALDRIEAAEVVQ